MTIIYNYKYKYSYADGRRGVNRDSVYKIKFLQFKTANKCCVMLYLIYN